MQVAGYEISKISLDIRVIWYQLALLTFLINKKVQSDDFLSVGPPFYLVSHMLVLGSEQAILQCRDVNLNIII